MSSTRAQILKEATQQLTSVGYTAFTVASVRDALGLSSGSMFHAFASKPALAAAVYVEGMSAYQRAALDAIEAEPDPAGAVSALIATHLCWIQDHPELARYLFSTLPTEVMELAQQPLSERNAAFYQRVEALFRSATAAGLMGPLDLSVAHALCIGPAQEYGRKWTRGLATAPPRALIRTLQAAALAGLASTRPARRTRTLKPIARRNGK